MAVGNAVVVGWVGVLRPAVDVPRLPAREIYSRGSYLVVSATMPALAGFVAANLVIAIGGSELLGFAEAARVVAQPVFVGATGLALVTNPQIMAGAVNGDAAGVVQARRVFLSLLWFAGLAYVVLLSLPGISDVLHSLLPTAFEVTGLVAMSVLAQVIFGMFRPYGAEAVALTREPAVLWATLPGAAVIVGVALGVPLIDAFVIPVGVAAGGLIRLWILAYLLRKSDAGAAPPAHEMVASLEAISTLEVIE
jgi:hypothetical protein